MNDEIDLKAEIQRLRDKSHEHANMLIDHEGRIIDLEDTTDTMEKTLIVLESQSKILKYLLGVATAILISVVSNAITI